MIVGSLLLILVAVGLLVAGVLSGSNMLIILSIVATVIAAVILIVGVRQSASDEDDYDTDEDERESASSSRGGREVRREPRESARRSRSSGRDTAEGGASEASAERGATMVERRGSIPAQAREYDSDTADATPVAAETATGPYEPAESVEEMDEDPPGEPSAQVTTSANAERIALLTTEVLVVDGRPRYHTQGCVHLLGRDSEPLPVGEALELGFTPCSMCEPDSSLLAEARPV